MKKFSPIATEHLSCPDPAIWEDDFVIIDAHCHLTAELPAADLAKVMDQGGVDKAVLLAEGLESVPPDRPTPVPGSRSPRQPGSWPLPGLSIRTLMSPLNPLGRFRYASFIEDGVLRDGKRYYRVIPTPDNEPVAAASDHYPNRFIPFVYVNPNDPAHTDVVDHYLARGFRGVKVNAWFHNVDLGSALSKVARRCGDAGRPVLIHLGGTRRTSLSVFELIDRYPTTDFIMAHAGIPCYSWLWRAARIHPNLYFDLSGPFMTAELVNLIAARVPPGRLLFASGCPQGLRTAGGGHDYAGIRPWVDSLEVSAEARRAILGGTLQRLVGLAREGPSAASGSRGGQYSSRFGR